MIYVKGQCYDEFKKQGAEGPMFDMVDIGHGQIMIFKKNPSDAEVENFLKISKFELGLLYFHNQILFTLNTDQTDPMDMTYAPQMSHVVTPDELKDYPEPEGGLNLNLMLINSVSGELKGMHVYGTDLKFHQEFAKDVRAKMATVYSREEDKEELKSIYAMYPNTKKLAKAVDVMFKHQD